MRRGYLKNAVLLTGADVLLRLAGMGLRIYLAGALGGEGMGLYQLLLAVYSLFVTLATAGVSVAATRLLAEELSRDKAAARGMLARLAAAGLALGCAACAVQFALARLAAQWWLGDVRATAALRISSFGLPWMGLSAVLRGFFIARRHVEPNVLSQLGEQAFRIGVMIFALEHTQAWDIGARCFIVLAATAASEAVSALLMLAFYRREARRCFGDCAPARPPDTARRLWEILWPVEGGRLLSGALHTAENMLVPACLAVALQGVGGRTEAVTQYGNLKGMALPLLMFPFGLLGSLGVLLMPEITQAHICGESVRLRGLLERMLVLTGFFSALTGALFYVWGRPLALILYGSAEAGFYMEVLAPVMPLVYLESMVDGAMKGIGEQRAGFCYSVWDSILRIAGVLLLLPRFGMKGFLFVIVLSGIYTCAANTRRLFVCTAMQPHWRRLLGGPLISAAVCAAAGMILRQTLTPLFAGERLIQLAALTLGGGVSAAAGALAAWPLGLGAETRTAKNSTRGKE